MKKTLIVTLLTTSLFISGCQERSSYKQDNITTENNSTITETIKSSEKDIDNEYTDGSRNPDDFIKENNYLISVKEVGTTCSIPLNDIKRLTCKTDKSKTTSIGSLGLTQLFNVIDYDKVNGFEKYEDENISYENIERGELLNKKEEVRIGDFVFYNFEDNKLAIQVDGNQVMIFEDNAVFSL